ncbi:ESPR-type extended signal peptide-containing protein, partial [Undibacterium luofuense]|uniref:ESPR-type extended signal peptide-containing protein n=1 Tax=Undibacterium luofuense TaxID=2828733 RepID=UPI0030EB9D88
MNKVHRVVWNKATESWGAAPETAKCAGAKGASTTSGAKRSVPSQLRKLPLILAAAFAPTLAFAQIELQGDTSPNGSTVKQPEWVVNGGLLIGNAGTGSMSITEGGSVEVNGRLIIGNQKGSNGTVVVEGKDSSLLVNDNVFVGSAGSGRLEIKDGASVSNRGDGHANIASVLIGNLGGEGEGEVLITGKNSSWITDSTLSLGDGGRLTVEKGGQMKSTSVDIGNQYGNSSQISVTGQGSSLIATNALHVGHGGKGQLDVLDGGTVTSAGGHIATAVRGSGTANIDGAGSRWNAGTLLYISSEGVLNLTNGGTAQAERSVVEKNGTMRIGGADSVIDAGTLDTKRLLLDGVLDFNHTATGYDFAADFAHSSGKILQRAGVTHLTGNGEAFIGQTQVSGGTLIVDQALGNALSTTEVGANGTLAGTGVIGGAVTNAGTVSALNALSGHSSAAAGTFTLA